MLSGNNTNSLIRESKADNLKMRQTLETKYCLGNVTRNTENNNNLLKIQKQDDLQNKTKTGLVHSSFF